MVRIIGLPSLCVCTCVCVCVQYAIHMASRISSVASFVVFAFADWHSVEIGRALRCAESSPVSILNYSKYDLQASTGNECKNELVVAGVVVGWTWITGHENCERCGIKRAFPLMALHPNAWRMISICSVDVRMLIQRDSPQFAIILDLRISKSQKERDIIFALEI